MISPIKVAMIGCGGMARHHIRQMLQQAVTTQITVLCEPSEQEYQQTAAIFEAAGMAVPPNQPDLAKLLEQYPLDASFIVTPHVYHYEQTKACLEAGLDVLLEKPMVMNAVEAEKLIAVRDKTQRLLVVAFPGSLSPQIQAAVDMIRTNQCGRILGIEGVVWQGWGPGTANTWRQVPEIAGGGFLFDTGAHLLNTVVDLAGEDVVDVAAWFDYNNRPVETSAVIMGRLASGIMITLHACGETIRTCASQIQVFGTKAILRTGVWGEKLEVQCDGSNEFVPVPVQPSLGVWEQFVAVREGKIANPCPPEVGLRMSRLYDAVKLSASQGGRLVRSTDLAGEALEGALQPKP
jgi:predicted dehydrogenase